jgi:iron complex transport system substrate-binding protein
MVTAAGCAGSQAPAVSPSPEVSASPAAASPDATVTPEQTTVTVQDSANRIVEVPYPVQSVVVLWNNPTEIMTALGAVDRFVGIDTSTKDNVDQGLYPELKDMPVVGSSEEPNYEMIAELDPDVVIMLSTYPPLPDEVQEQLAAYDIAVVALDFYRTDVFSREVKTLGFMLGLEEKADELNAFFAKPLDEISSIIAGIPDAERKSVYFEGAKDYTTYGGAGYGSGIPLMIRMAGGMDLYPEISAAAFEADPEDVANRNPDVIVKGQSGGYFLTDDSQFKTVNEAIAARPELANTTAAKNGEVYTMSFDIAGGARKVFGPMYLAKILYPEQFKDFDPDAVLKEYLETYLGRTWQGVYVYPEK